MDNNERFKRCRTDLYNAFIKQLQVNANDHQNKLTHIEGKMVFMTETLNEKDHQIKALKEENQRLKTTVNRITENNRKMNSYMIKL